MPILFATTCNRPQEDRDILDASDIASGQSDAGQSDAGQSGTGQMSQGQPRARGRVRVGAVQRNDSTSLSDLHMSGSAKVLFPRQWTPELLAVFLNTAGGVTGGDCLDWDVTAAARTRVTVTTQAAERIYRAAPGAPGRVTSTLTVQEGARLTWLPQETILFDGAALDRKLTLTLAPDAHVLACETLVFGREAMGETVRNLHLRDRIDLFQGGKLVFADRLRLDGDAQAQLDRQAIARGNRALASVLFAAPGAGGQLDDIRAMLPDTGGASALSADLVFLRCLARDSFALRRTMVPLLERLSATDIPKTWTL